MEKGRDGNRVRIAVFAKNRLKATPDGYKYGGLDTWDFPSVSSNESWTFTDSILTKNQFHFFFKTSHLNAIPFSFVF